MASDENLNYQKSSLKRNRGNSKDGESEENDFSKRSCSGKSFSHPSKLSMTPHKHLPSPVTSQEPSLSSDTLDEPILIPQEPQTSSRNFDKIENKECCYSSPPEDTQAFSQLIECESSEVKKNPEDGILGSLIPIDKICGETLILKIPSSLTSCKGSNKLDPDKEKAEEESKNRYGSSRRYLIGRHPECDLIIADPLVSKRHAIIFTESKKGHIVAILEDVSSNGTFVNEGIIGRNKRRELQDFDEVAILDKARFVFRYTRQRYSSSFRQDYELHERLGKGHFAEVFRCVKKSTGHQYAVKILKLQRNKGNELATEGIKQEIGVLMSVNHSNILSLNDAYEEPNFIYLILELAPEGELFNWIIEREKLTENETRDIFLQLFQGVRYLHKRGILHRDIKPENVLLMNKIPNIKLADFGLAKIIGEESFTTSLCGTPSYVAPEILEESSSRLYNRAVDIWSLGVVLYICLCGFPPFSDELTNDKYPYTLTQQIKTGQFDYPSPYWDAVGDLALDLVDRMLTVNVEDRITIDECLEHPWLTQRESLIKNECADKLVGDLAQLDFSKRRTSCERTLLTVFNRINDTDLPSFEASESALNH